MLSSRKQCILGTDTNFLDEFFSQPNYSKMLTPVEYLRNVSFDFVACVKFILCVMQYQWSEGRRIVVENLKNQLERLQSAI